MSKAAQAKVAESKNSISSLLQKAADEQFYWEVDGSEERITKKHAVIGGALKKWKKNPKYAYVPDYRLSGDIDDVEDALRAMGVDPKNVRIYTADDYEEDDFVEEFEEYKQHLKDNKSDSMMNDEDFFVHLAGFSHMRIHKPNANTQTRFTYTKPKERYESIPAGKVLDVSKRHGKGEGSSVMEKKKVLKTHFQGLSSIKIVSANEDNYYDELVAIGLWTDEQIDAAVAAWRKNRDAHVASTKKTVALGAGIRPVVARR